MRACACVRMCACVRACRACICSRVWGSISVNVRVWGRAVGVRVGFVVGLFLGE